MTLNFELKIYEYKMDPLWGTGNIIFWYSRIGDPKALVALVLVIEVSVFLFKFFYAAFSINKLLFACIEWVASGADIDIELF